MAAVFPGAIATSANLYIAANQKSALLTDNPLTIGATTVNVNSTTGFPTIGAISIDAEIIFYTGITATSFTGCTRGADGTSAAAHSVGAQVDHNVIAQHHNSQNDEIIAIETHLGVNGANIVHIAGTETITGTKTLSSFSGTLAANLAAGGFKVTGLAAGTTNGDSLRYEQVIGVYALDSTVVHLAGTESITGAKTFSANVTISKSTPALILSAGANTTISYTRYDTNSNSQQVYVGTEDSVGGALLTGSSAYAAILGGFGNFPLQLGTNNTVRLGISGAGDIGITSGKKLYLDGAVTFGDTYITESAANQIDIFTAGTSAITIDSGQRVGIGTTSPSSYNTNARDLVIRNTSGVTGVSISSGTDSNCFLAFQDTESTTIPGLIQYAHNATGANERMSFRVNGLDDRVSISPNNGTAIVGTTTNDSAAAGIVGESITAEVTSFTNTPASNAFGDLASIALTPGDWDLTMTIEYFNNGATWTATDSGISDTSGNSATNLVRGRSRFQTGWASSSTAITQVTYSIASLRISTTSSNTYYLKYKATFSAGTPQAIGIITARRVR